MELTTNQKQFLTLNDKNILLSASAGSGKTFILIEKICNLIIDNNEDINNFLVLTFTNAAANELKKRLEVELKKNSSEFALRELEKLPSASICTFDSFCSNLLKRYFFKVNINPNFNVLLDDEAEILKVRSFNYSLEKLFNNNKEDYFFVFKEFKLNKDTKNLYDIICKLYNFYYGSKIKFDEINIEKNKYYKFLNDYICDKYSNLTKTADSIILKLKENEMLKEIAICNQITSFLNSIKIENGLIKNIELINLLELSKMPSLNKNYNFIQESYYNKLKKLKKYLTDLTNSIKKIEFNEEIFDKCYKNNEKNLNLLIYIYNNFIDFYDNLKQEKNLFDFINIEKLTLDLLKNNADICENLKLNYKYIYIDEYQDTSTIQEEIINLIKKDNNLTVVGDIKQSIYRFRKASPGLFINKLYTYPQKDNSIILNLNENFRSNKNILNFCNIIFKNLITEYSSKINYIDNSMFVPGAEYKKSELPSVELIDYSVSQEENVNVQEVYDLNNDKQLNSVSNGTIEADIVASKIIKLCSSQIYDLKKQKFRDVCFKDISILIQKRGDFYNDFIKRLEQLNIPFKSNITMDLLDNTECCILVDLLNIIDNLNNDICLISVLYSCFGKFSNKEITEIANQTDYEYFYEKFINYNKDEKLKEKIKNFIKFINNTKKEISLYGIYEVLNKLIIDYKYIYYYTKKLESINVQSNVNNFIKIFKNFDDFSINSALDILNNKDKKSIVESKNIDAINISTIHYSKGLEYPIVFLVNTNSNLIKTGKESIITEELGLAFSNDEGNLLEKIVNFFDKKEDFMERIRLLYVALTRAKNNLFIIGKKEKEKEIFDVFECNSFYDLITYALQCEDISLENNEYFKYTFINNLDVDNSAIQLEKDYSLENILNIFNKIENRKDQNISFKNTVTLLSNDGEYFNPIPNKLSLNELQINNNSIDTGIKYHSILENIDFEKNIDEILKNLKYLNCEDFNLISNAIIKIKNLINFKVDKIYKEKTFVSKFSYSELVSSSNNDKVLLQGKVDLLILGEKNILVDYKYSSKNDNMLIQTYKKQLSMYKLAIESAFKIKLDKIYLLNLKTAKLVNI